MPASKSPRVFITHENPVLNYESAEKFGHVVFVTARDFAPSDNSKYNMRVIDEIRREIADFDPDGDYIAISGSPPVTAVVFLVLGQILPRGRDLRVLRWDKITNRYQPIIINL